jgi:ATP-dependent DNA helicase RecQ
MPSLPADSPARRILSEVFGYSSFRPGQEEVIASILDGTGVLTVMPTGSGKSLCFQVPALVHDGLTLVVSPLVALMEDQVAALKLDGVAAETINSSRERETNVAAWRRVAAGEVRLLYISPERLMTERMLAALRRLPVELIAIDEAHCISRWGPSFRPDYEALTRLTELFPGVPLAAFTATADESTRKDISAKLFQGRGHTVVTGFDRPNIRLAVETRRDGTRQLLDFVRARPGQSGIVYCLSRKKTEAAAEERPARPALPRGAGERPARRQPGHIHDRAERGHGRHHRLRHGHRQARRALRLPRRLAREHGGLLPGAGPGRSRRRARRRLHAVRPERYPPAPHVYRGGRRGRRP